MTRQAEPLTDHEATIAARALIEGTAPLPVTDETADRFEQWIRSTVTGYALLELILAGKITVRWSHDNQDWMFNKRDT